MQREKKTCETSIIIYRERERGRESERASGESTCSEARISKRRRGWEEDRKSEGRTNLEENCEDRILSDRQSRKDKEEGKRKGGEKGSLNALVVDGWQSTRTKRKAASNLLTGFRGSACRTTLCEDYVRHEVEPSMFRACPTRKAIGPVCRIRDGWSPANDSIPYSGTSWYWIIFEEPENGWETMSSLWDDFIATVNDILLFIGSSRVFEGGGKKSCLLYEDFWNREREREGEGWTGRIIVSTIGKRKGERAREWRDIDAGEGRKLARRSSKRASLVVSWDIFNTPVSVIHGTVVFLRSEKWRARTEFWLPVIWNARKNSLFPEYTCYALHIVDPPSEIPDKECACSPISEWRFLAG